MERLIADANEWGAANGKASNLSIDSFSDVVTAIEQIQEKQNIAGTTAREASTTIAGSIGSVKAAWQNLVAGFADGNADISGLISNVVGTAKTAFTNLLPVVKQAFTGIGTALREITPIVAKELPSIAAEILPAAVQSAGTLLASLASALPGLFKAVVDVVPQLWDGIKTASSKAATAIFSLLNKENISNVSKVVVNLFKKITSDVYGKLPDVAKAAKDVVVKFADGLSSKAKIAVDAFGEVLKKALTAVGDALPDFAEAAGSIIVAFGDGIIESLPGLIDKLPEILDALVNGILKGATKLAEAGVKLLSSLFDNMPAIMSSTSKAVPKIIANLVKSLISYGPDLAKAGLKLLVNIALLTPKAVIEIVKSIPKIVVGIIKELGAHAPEMAKAGLKLLTSIVLKISDAVKSAKEAATKIFNGIKEKIGASSLADVGIKLLKSLFERISEAVGKAREAAYSIWDGIRSSLAGKSLYDIGKNLINGLLNGIKSKATELMNGVGNLANGVVNKFASVFQIHSPSRKTYEQGKNLAQGLANGISDNKKEAIKSASEMSQAVLDIAKKRIDNDKVYHKWSLDAEIAYWAEVRKQVSKGTEARIEADKTYFELLSQEKEARLDAKKEAATITKEYVKAYKAVGTELAKQKSDLYSKLTEDIAKIDEKLDEEVKKLDDEYAKAIDARKKTISGFFGLFDNVETKTSEVSSGDLIKNLQSQVYALKEWDITLSSLAERIGSTSPLYEELQGMNISSLETLRQLNRMSDEELSAYANLYDQKQQIAQERAIVENEMYKKNMESEVAALREKAQAERMALESETAKNIYELQKNAQKQMDTLTNQYNAGLAKLVKESNAQGESIGKAITDGIKSGLEKTQKSLTKATKAIVQQAILDSKSSISESFSSLNASLAVGVSGTKSLTKTSAASGTAVKSNSASKKEMQQVLNDALTRLEKGVIANMGAQAIVLNNREVGRVVKNYA